MKNLKKIIFLLFCTTFVLTSLSSCLDSDDDNTQTITAEEASAMFKTLQGTHSGDLYALFDSNGSVYSVFKDSIPNLQTIVSSDTLVSVYSVPDSIFAQSLSSGNTTENAFAQALRKSTNSHPLQSKISYLTYYDKEKTTNLYVTNYASLNLPVEIDGAQKLLTLVYYMRIYYTPSTKQISTLIYPYSMSYDQTTVTPSTGVYYGVLSPSK